RRQVPRWPGLRLVPHGGRHRRGRDHRAQPDALAEQGHVRRGDLCEQPREPHEVAHGSSEGEAWIGNAEARAERRRDPRPRRLPRDVALIVTGRMTALFVKTFTKLAKSALGLSAAPATGGVWWQRP